MKGKMAKKGIELVFPLFLLLSPKCTIFDQTSKDES